jgi:hypothetical protein
MSVCPHESPLSYLHLYTKCSFSTLKYILKISSLGRIYYIFTPPPTTTEHGALHLVWSVSA